MRKILVIVDMQNDFITGALGNAECEASVQEVVNVIKNNKYDNIFLTRDTHHDNYMETQEGKNLPVPHCIENTEGWEIVDAVKEAVNSYDSAKINVIDKPTFGSIELGESLAEIYHKEDAIIDFCGVCTGICVISNVMIAKANCPEAEIRVHEKACACVTPESHKNAIDAMKLCQIGIL